MARHGNSNLDYYHSIDRGIVKISDEGMSAVLAQAVLAEATAIAVTLTLPVLEINQGR